MAKILLVSFNARYEHTSLGLRCLMANMENLSSECSLKEFTLDTSAETALEDSLAFSPEIIGLGVYIWNVENCLKFAMELKNLRPEIKLVCGGPEISHAGKPGFSQYAARLAEIADYVICGEGENSFRELCCAVLAGNPPENKFICPVPVDLEETKLPYSLYSDEDIQNRLVYIEASRGCPFGCEFCLSSLDKNVRYFPLETLFENLKCLLERGLLAFKFTDRSFNLDVARAEKILRFFLENYRPGLFLHFEIVPGKMPEKLFSVIAEFPAGTVQLEAGIQTFNEETAALISRRQDNELLERNIRRILSETGCYVHADLVAGLPGETLESFAAGFDRLYGMGVHEIQAGILKLLGGAPIARHTAAYGMKYSPLPPYEIRETDAVSFADMRRLRRFSRYWDIIANSGAFRGAARIICGGLSAADTGSSSSILENRCGSLKNICSNIENIISACENSSFYSDNNSSVSNNSSCGLEHSCSATHAAASPFWRFMRLSDALYAATHQTHSISRARLRNFISDWLISEEKMPEAAAKRIMEQDALKARRAEKHKTRQARRTP